jgi:hypothetical protein
MERFWVFDGSIEIPSRTPGSLAEANFIDELTNGGRAVLGEGLPGECSATGRAEDSESMSRASMR